MTECIEIQTWTYEIIDGKPIPSKPKITKVPIKDIVENWEHIFIKKSIKEDSR